MASGDPKPYFKTVKSFADVPSSDLGVETSAFLDASDGLVKLFDDQTGSILTFSFDGRRAMIDLLGSGVFAFVQADLRKNIQGVRERVSHSPSTSTTLEILVQEEHVGGNRQATGCLLRLLRGLSFTRTALQNSQDNKQEELTVSFKRAYDTTLRHHHGLVVRTVVSVAIKACPRRSDFYARIAQGDSQDALETELAKWLFALELLLNRMGEFYERGGYGRI